MKSIKYSFLLFTFLLASISWSQNKIVVNDDTKLTRTFFSNGERVKITPFRVEKGFKLLINENIFSKAEAQSKNGDWEQEVLGDPDIINGFITYDAIFEVSPNTTIKIKLFLKGNNEKFLKLKVSADETPIKSFSSCIPSNQKNITFLEKNFKNKFGEEEGHFNKNKIVFVYDFNPDPVKRDFYKVSYDEDEEDNLKIELADFNKESLGTNKNVKFKVYNINKFIYDISIADSVVHFKSDPPALLKNFFLGDTSSMLGGLMDSFYRNIIPNKSGANYRLDSTIHCFITKFIWLKKTALSAFDPSTTYPKSYSIDFGEFLNPISYIKSQTKIVESELKNAIKDNIECNECLKQKIKTETEIKGIKIVINKLKKQIHNISSINSSIQNRINKVNAEINSIDAEIYYLKGSDSLTKMLKLKKLTAELASKKTELAENKSKFQKLQKEKDSLEIKSSKLSISIDTLKFNINEKCSEKAQEIISTLETSKYFIENLPSEKDIKELVLFVNNMTEKHNSYTTDYISLNGNMLDLTISISTKDTINKLMHGVDYEKTTQIQIPITGKPFASFSSGSFIALGKNMQNKTYTWQETIDNNNVISDTSFTLVESGYTLPPMGFCALGNLEFKLTRSFGLGFSVGVGLSIEKSPRLAYLGGLSIFLGDQRQFTITGGFSGMQVNKLSNNFQTISDNQIIYNSKPNIEYYKEFKVGAFISLTYTPFKSYKTKGAKNKKDE